MSVLIDSADEWEDDETTRARRVLKARERGTPRRHAMAGARAERATTRGVGVDDDGAETAAARDYDGRDEATDDVFEARVFTPPREALAMTPQSPMMTSAAVSPLREPTDSIALTTLMLPRDLAEDGVLPVGKQASPPCR